MVAAMQIAGISITGVLLAKLLQKYAPEQAVLMTLLLGTLITGCAVTAMMPVLTEIDALLSAGGLNPEQIALVTKAVGICCVTQLASDLCKDAGESAMASGVLLTGKVTLILLAIPLFTPLRQMLEEVISCVSFSGL